MKKLFAKPEYTLINRTPTEYHVWRALLYTVLGAFAYCFFYISFVEVNDHSVYALNEKEAICWQIKDNGGQVNGKCYGLEG
ncbi:hypothetical protein [Stenotrophomonas acidaminiphila]